MKLKIIVTDAKVIAVLTTKTAIAVGANNDAVVTKSQPDYFTPATITFESQLLYNLSRSKIQALFQLIKLLVSHSATYVTHE